MAMRGIIKAVLKLAFEEYWIKDNPYDRVNFKKYDSDSHDRDVIVGHTKTYVTRRFPITNEIQSFLERYLAIHERYHSGDPHLFPEPKNESGVISNRAVYKYYVRICRNLGIEISKDRSKGLLGSGEKGHPYVGKKGPLAVGKKRPKSVG